jgi:heat-inducible transcriptional repressor
MVHRHLTEREKQVLQVLIDHYITTAKPVGSQTLTTRYHLGVSPATIRNTMADLEDLGLITHLHASGGRIPTDAGYREYVDNILKPVQLSNAERQKIRSGLEIENLALGPILEQTSRVLAYISNQLGVTIAPRFESGILTRITLVPVAEKRVLVVVAVKSGLVRSIVMEVETELRPEMTEDTASLLTERLAGLTLGDIKATIRDRISGISSGDPTLLELFIDSCDRIFAEHIADKIHFGGAANLARNPEFSDVGDFTRLIGMVEDRTFLAALFSSDETSEETQITIGKKFTPEGPNVVSLVTSPYRAGKSRGILGVMGPTRMPYSKIVSVVDYTARLLSRMLSK